MLCKEFIKNAGTDSKFNHFNIPGIENVEFNGKESV